MSNKYRKVSQMSSSWSPKFCPKSEDTLQLDVKRSCSLPNIGNTCFLNSVIQVLLRVAIIKDFLLGYNGKNQLLTCLKLLFQQIIEQASAQRKKKTLFSIQRHIQPRLLDYSSGNQYDSFETLLIFLNAMFEENSQLQRELSIEYTQKCKCDGHQQLREIYIEKQPKRCSKCNHILSTALKKVPECFIVKDNKKTEMPKELSSAFKDYNLVSKNIYRGTGSFGHYYALTKFEKFYELNDERVTMINQQKFESEVCMFSVYERKGVNNYGQKRPFENPEQENQENQCSLIEWIKKNPGKAAILLVFIIGLCVGLGIGINKAQASSSSSQSSNFETHQGLSQDKQNHRKKFVHKVKDFSRLKFDHSASYQGSTKEKQSQEKQKNQKNLQSEEDQKINSKQKLMQEAMA